MGCAEKKHPGVYTSVEYYFDWVHDVICKDSDTKASWCNKSAIGYFEEKSLNEICRLPKLTNALTETPTASTTKSQTTSCRSEDQFCTYGSECCSNTCKAYSLSDRRCVKASVTSKDRYSKDKGGAAGYRLLRGSNTFRVGG